MWPSLLLKALPFVAAAALGALGMRYWDSLRYSHLQAQYSQYQAQVAQAELVSQKAVADALMKQAAEHRTIQEHNQQVIHDLEQRSANAAAQHDSDSAFIRKLLNGTPKAASTPGSHSVPEASDRSEASRAGGESSSQALAVNLCVDTKAEDERNADKLDALIAQLKPQL